MSKYQPLYDRLASTRGELTLTLDQIEAIVPGIAPSHQKHAIWWKNDDPSHSHCRAWNDAGYDAHPDLARGRVRFVPRDHE